MRGLRSWVSGAGALTLTLALGLVLGLVLVLVATPTPTQAASTIEAHYNVAGPSAVTTATVSVPSGTFKLYYPTDLGAGGADHPIVTWGNGTNATPDNYPGLLNRLASWGFVVVASTSTATGSGDEVLAGANYLVSQNGDPSSVFYQHLDTSRVGAAGHSQGASGALNATTKSNGLITSTVVFNLPNPIWVSSQHKTDFTKIVDPVLFLTGSRDTLISSPSGNTGYYNQVAGPAAKAVLVGADHNTIQNTGGGYLGYLVAWFDYTLRGSAYARGAYVGTPPEINTNAAWSNQAEKNLP